MFTPDFGLPLASRAFTTTRVESAPSTTRMVESASIVIATPNSDGPVSDGGSWLFIVQALTTATTGINRAPAATRAKDNVRSMYLITNRGELHSRIVTPAYFGSPKFPNSTEILAVVLTERPVWSCP